MALSRVQVGAIGEALFFVYALRSSGGQIECFGARADDDHRDFVVGRRGATRNAYVQVKSDNVLRGDRIQASARFPTGQVFEHPGFLYAVLYTPDVAIETAWLVPSPDFNRLALHEKLAHDRVQLLMHAHTQRQDGWARFRIPPDQLGTRLLDQLDRLDQAGLLPATPPPWQSTPPVAGGMA